MPTLVSRAEALEAIAAERGDTGCLMCALVDRAIGAVYAVYEDDDVLVMLPRYVRCWGTMMVIPKKHVTHYAEIETAVWSQANALALQAARAVEQVFSPLRCYIASVGSNVGVHDLTQSSKHLHLHVIPVREADTRPADVFSWSDGITIAEPAEWEALRDTYRRAWASLDAA